MAKNIHNYKESYVTTDAELKDGFEKISKDLDKAGITYSVVHYFDDDCNYFPESEELQAYVIIIFNVDGKEIYLYAPWFQGMDESEVYDKEEEEYNIPDGADVYVEDFQFGDYPIEDHLTGYGKVDNDRDFTIPALSLDNENFMTDEEYEHSPEAQKLVNIIRKDSDGVQLEGFCYYAR